MTYKVDPKTKKTTLTPNELESSQYNQGFQNRKMERQAIKGLTPKYCYFGLANNYVDSGTFGIIFFDRFENNDRRMTPDSASPLLTIPAKGLYTISGLASLSSTSTSHTYGMYVNKNGGDFGNGNVFYDVRKGVGGSLGLHLSFTAILNQGDQITMTYDSSDSGTKTFLADYTHLRVISYVLY